MKSTHKVNIIKEILVLSKNNFQWKGEISLLMMGFVSTENENVYEYLRFDSCVWQGSDFDIYTCCINDFVQFNET